MPFRRGFGNRGGGIRPVNRTKHVIDLQAAVTAGGTSTLTLADAIDAPTLAVTNSCQIGSKINAIYLKCEAYATSSAALSNFYMIVFKNPGNNIGSPAPNTVGANDNKRFVIHQEMVMLQKEQASELGGNPRVVFNGVIVIPKGYRRMGPNDRLVAHFLSPGVSVEFCLQCHYKEFR